MEELNDKLLCGNSYTTAIGNIAELDIINLLKTFADIENVWKDYSNSKFDIYFKFYKENCIRGLQVKAITPIKDKSTYKMNHLDKYENGMLVVGINNKEKIGLAYIISEKYRVTTAQISKNSICDGVFNELLMSWNDFIIHFENILKYSIIITVENHKNSMSPECYKEYQSIKRFIVFCNKYKLTYSRIFDNSSVTDLIVEGMKVQMKYASNPSGVSNRTYSYKICLGTSKGPYKQGDNDLYIIELGSNHGDFLILSEKILIEKGYIQTNEQKGKKNLNVYPHDYVEKKLLTTIGHKSKIKGNWSCDKSLWISTEKGFLYQVDKFFRLSCNKI
jgi:hypothetical protein